MQNIPNINRLLLYRHLLFTGRLVGKGEELLDLEFPRMFGFIAIRRGKDKSNPTELSVK